MTAKPPGASTGISHSAAATPLRTLASCGGRILHPTILCPSYWSRPGMITKRARRWRREYQTSPQLVNTLPALPHRKSERVGETKIGLPHTFAFVLLKDRPRRLWSNALGFLRRGESHWLLLCTSRRILQIPCHLRLGNTY